MGPLDSQTWYDLNVDEVEDFADIHGTTEEEALQILYDEYLKDFYQ